MELELSKTIPNISLILSKNKFPWGDNMLVEKGSKSPLFELFFKSKITFESTKFRLPILTWEKDLVVEKQSKGIIK